MTDRDRLIELFKNMDKNFEITCPNLNTDKPCKGCKYHLPNEINTCNSLERKVDYFLANGVTLLPLPIGSTVYEIRARSERSYKHREYDYGIPTNFALHNAIEMGAELYIAPKKFTKSDSVRLNKTVFLTKEEAEQKLKELKK